MHAKLTYYKNISLGSFLTQHAFMLWLTCLYKRERKKQASNIDCLLAGVLFNLKINYTLTRTNEHLPTTSEPKRLLIRRGTNRPFLTKSKNHSRRWKYALPDLIKICFICDEQIKVKYNLPRKKYSQKNIWGYWTERSSDQHKYICNACLKKNLIGRFEDWGVKPAKSRIFHIYLSRNRFEGLT